MKLPSSPLIIEESLPFTVRLVSTEEDLNKAVSVRYAAYARRNRRNPVFAETLREPEETDFEPNIDIILVESKLDNAPLGTVRVQINRDLPLYMENFIDLPLWLKGKTLSSASRFGVSSGSGSRWVKETLFKALFQYWSIHSVDFAVVAAHPPLTGMYEDLLFNDVLAGNTFVPRRGNNVPHQVLAFEIATAKERWIAANHPLMEFVFYKHHPDIDISQAGWASPTKP